MKAIRVHNFGDPGVLQLEKVEKLSSGPNEILIDIKAVGVNPVDTYIRSGNYSLKPTLPYTPGFDAAGVVQNLGEQITGHSIGERVYLTGSISGTYAEQTLCRWDDVFPLPDFLSFEQGAAIGITYTTAHQALFAKGQATEGESVLIHGASGGVGMAAVHLAQTGNLKIFATAGTAQGLDLLKQQGVDCIFNHTEVGYREKILKQTAGKGVNLILEMLANENLGEDLKILAHGGRVVVIGSRGEVLINPRDIMARGAAIFGMVILNMSREERHRIDKTLTEIIFKKNILPVVGKIFPLAEAAEAHKVMMAGGATGKIILVP